MIHVASTTTIREAALILREGGLVVVPTETVYGLAGDAMNAEAVFKIFEAKGRPADNPLIVHIADMETLRQVALTLPEKGARLAARFWPGPLTLVLPKAEGVPDVTTGGLSTVAVRMPDHPVALALIQESGCPLAAPSANRFMQLSPTRARDVESGLAEFILDGGDCRIGVESTVVDLSGDVPRLLRPGGVTRADLEACLGEPLLAPPSGPRRSPGQYARHYAPRTPLEVVEKLDASMPGLTFGAPQNEGQRQMPSDAKAYASMLYAVLHGLDRLGFDRLYVEELPQGPDWEAVQDRLKRATG